MYYHINFVDKTGYSFIDTISWVCFIWWACFCWKHSTILLIKKVVVDNKFKKININECLYYYLNNIIDINIELQYKQQKYVRKLLRMRVTQLSGSVSLKSQRYFEVILNVFKSLAGWEIDWSIQELPSLISWLRY